MTVGELTEKMTLEEYIGWTMFFAEMNSEPTPQKPLETDWSDPEQIKEAFML